MTIRRVVVVAVAVALVCSSLVSSRARRRTLGAAASVSGDYPLIGADARADDGAVSGERIKWSALNKVSSSSDGHVRRTDEGSGWNAGAVSERVITGASDTVRGISAKCDQTDTFKMIGLNAESESDNYKDLDFALYCSSGGGLRVFESGRRRWRGSPSQKYSSGSEIHIIVSDAGKVEYYLGTDLLYTSGASVKYPLHADVSIYSPGGSFSEVKWIERVVFRPPSRPPPPPAAVSGERIKWSALNGVYSSSDGHIRRTAMRSGWNAGAVSERVITGASDTARGISAKCDQTDTIKLIGLNANSESDSYKDLDFALYCSVAGSLYVFESGVPQWPGFSSKTYSSGSEIHITVSDAGRVEYYLGTDLLYTSRASVKYPLHADVSIYSPGGSFSEVKWIERVVFPPPPRPPPPPAAVSGERIKWSALKGVSSSSDGHVRRTDGRYGFNAGAVSERVITGASDTVRGISAKCDQTDTLKMIGLNTKSESDSLEDLDFALFCASGGKLYVSESGHKQWSGGSSKTYSSGSEIHIIVSDAGKVEYYLGTDLLYRSWASVTYPLHADVSMLSPGGSFSEVKWIERIVFPPQPPPPPAAVSGERIKWSALNKVSSSPDGHVRRTDEGYSGWNAGAVSERAITGASDTVRGISAKCDQTDTLKMIGLNSKSESDSFEDLDFALFCDYGGKLYVYESGRRREFFWQRYSSGSEIHIIVSDAGKVEYYLGTDLLYTSGASVTYPLHADVSIYDPEGSFSEVKWIERVVPSPPPPAGAV